jgi:hypothetical protein
MCCILFFVAMNTKCSRVLTTNEFKPLSQSNTVFLVQFPTKKDGPAKYELRTSVLSLGIDINGILCICTKVQSRQSFVIHTVDHQHGQTDIELTVAASVV